MDNGKLIFTERPYAAVVNDCYIHMYCANCFGEEPTFPCHNGCEFANYCDEECSNEDWPWHQFECTAFRKCMQENRKPKIWPHCRLVGRLLARFRQDQGDASLSEGLPTGVKDRKLGDMKSHHYNDFKKDRKKWKMVQKWCSQFFEFFGSTELKDTKPKTVRIFLCTYMIYGFSLKHHIGYGLYPNATRFDHSCNPTTFDKFDGNTIQVWAYENVHPDEYSTENRFNQLTSNYGTPCQSCCGLNLTRQRVDYFKGSYFRCLCSACVDSKTILIEERAAVHECGECGTPYIWTKKGRLQQVCKCKQSVPDTTQQQKRAALKLEKQWKNTMQQSDRRIPQQAVIDLCEPFVETAKKLWHHTENLRMGLVVERLCMAYRNLRPNVDLSERACRRRAECFFALADYYDRYYWGHDFAQGERRMGDYWQHYRTELGPAKEEPIDVDAA